MLTNDQKTAWNKLIEWVENLNEPFFVLAGYAGTGKSFLMKHFIENGYTSDNDYDIHFTATTNKAAKVLSQFIKQETKTIYSLLGLSVTENEDRLQLFKLDKNDSPLSEGSIVVIDEASMVGPELFANILQETRHGARFIFVGDPAQLPPVKEKESPVWEFLKDEKNSAKLLEVVRNDNQLLNLATNIRKCIIKSNYSNSPIYDDFDGVNGVRLFSNYREFKNELIKAIPSFNVEETRVIAWRNKSVDYYNEMIRDALGYKEPWVKGEKILAGSPIIRKAPDNKFNKIVVAPTDEEFSIVDIDNDTIYLDDFDLNIDVWTLEVKEIPYLLKIPRDQDEIKKLLNKQRNIALESKGSDRKEAWRKWWTVTNTFDDIRYAYAITTHKSQGTTLKTCFVDQEDILINPNKKEAFRSLYVAATRPTQSLYTF